MRLLWDMDGIRISDTTRVKWIEDEPWIVGEGMVKVTYSDGFKGNIAFTWEATALPKGYIVRICPWFPSVKMYTWEGRTFNLPLEIASGVKHHIGCTKEHRIVEKTISYEAREGIESKTD